MNISFYGSILNIFGMLGWIVLLFLVFFTSPYSLKSYPLIIFFAAFFLAIVGSYSMIEYNLRKSFFKLTSPTIHLKNAFRHGLLLAIVLNILLILQYLRVLSWWSAGLLILIVLSIELYFRSK